MKTEDQNDTPWNNLPKEPPIGLLMSMAIRFDHGLAVPGYYDQLRAFQPNLPSHSDKVMSAIGRMRQLYEEVSGSGFYSPEKEESYAAAFREAAGKEGAR